MHVFSLCLTMCAGTSACVHMYTSLGVPVYVHMPNVCAGRSVYMSCIRIVLCVNASVLARDRITGVHVCACFECCSQGAATPPSRIIAESPTARAKTLATCVVSELCGPSAACASCALLARHAHPNGFCRETPAPAHPGPAMGRSPHW